MRPMLLLAIALIGLGIAAWSYQGYVWIRGKETVAQVGPVKVERERDFPIPLAPILGGLALLGGIVLLTTRSRDTA